MRPRRIPGLPDCPECNATVEELVHIVPGIASAKPCGCVFASDEFFPDELLEADHQHELITDGGQFVGGIYRWGSETSECEDQAEEYEQEPRDVVQSNHSVAWLDVFWPVGRASCFLPAMDCHRPFWFEYGNETVQQQQNWDEIHPDLLLAQLREKSSITVESRGTVYSVDIGTHFDGGYGR